jgi:methylase of polypeptide subunit release factors
VTESPFHITSEDEYARIREALRRVGYHEKGLIDVLGPVRLPERAGRDLPHFLHLTREATPLNALIRLFVIGSPVDEAAARRALTPLEDWIRAGLIETHGGAVHGLVRLLPFRDLLLACDHADVLEQGGRLEQVMGITASSVALVDFAVRKPIGAALDLGCGGGIQSFMAAAHSREVCGADRSARSVAFAHFNAGLNGISNCEFQQGDSYEPVRGRKFDLVVSNPPFAITPSQRYMYRDSGVELDGFSRSLARQAPEFLNEGGLFQMCCDWVHIAGQDWKERLKGWFEGTGCDAWVLRTDHHTAADYARVWIRDTEHETPEASGRLYDEWIAYYESKGVEAVSTGLIAMRRASSHPNWIRIEDAPDDMAGAIGEYIALGFELHDYLETARDDERLLAERLRVSPLVRLEQSCEWNEDGWRVSSARIRLSRGITYSSPIDLRLAGMMARSNGQRTVRELLAELAKATNSDLEKITPNLLGLLRELIERGFLLPLSLRRD